MLAPRNAPNSPAVTKPRTGKSNSRDTAIQTSPRTGAKFPLSGTDIGSGPSVRASCGCKASAGGSEDGPRPDASTPSASASEPGSNGVRGTCPGVWSSDSLDTPTARAVAQTSSTFFSRSHPRASVCHGFGAATDHGGNRRNALFQKTDKPQPSGRFSPRASIRSEAPCDGATLHSTRRDCFDKLRRLIRTPTC